MQLLSTRLDCTPRLALEAVTLAAAEAVTTGADFEDALLGVVVDRTMGRLARERL